jgi:hypothetical protein
MYRKKQNTETDPELKLINLDGSNSVFNATFLTDCLVDVFMSL